MAYKNYDMLSLQQKVNEIDNKCEKDYVDEKVNDISSSLEEKANKTDVNDKFSKVNSSLEEKANNADLQIQKARIDNFTTLAEGSTTGDAELADGRTGADGITYTNIGGAIRGQYNVLKESLIKTNENLNNQFGYSLEYDITWIENEGYDTSTGIAKPNTTVRRTNLINFSEMFIKLGGSVEYKNVTSKMLVLLFNADKSFNSTVSWDWILGMTDNGKVPATISYFAVMEEKTENFRIVTTKKEINDIKNNISSLKSDVSGLKNTPHMLISYFEAENTNGVHLGISYDGVNFDKIGKVFENDETRDPCLIKHNNVYYLIYSHWGEFKKMNVPIYKSIDLMNWTLHYTLPIDLSSFGSGYDEIWAPEFYKDNNGTLCLTFGSRITSTGVVNGFVGIMNNEITTISNIKQIHIPNITDTFDVSFYNDNGIYYAVCHSETFGTLKETFVYKSNNLFGEYTKVSQLPTLNYNEGLCIEKVGDTFYIYADEKVSENENPDRRQLVLYTSKDMLTFDRTVCGTNFRHSKIIKADEIDMARLERAMIVKKYLNQ